MTTSKADSFVSCLSVGALLLTTVPALDSTLSDIEGVRASAAEEAIQSRGYHAHHTSRGDGGRYTYWWNNNTRSCVRTLTSNGVIAATKTVDAVDCGAYGGSRDQSSGSRGNGAVAAAASAAAILGVVALAHKSHHRDDQEYQDPNDYAEFERGHRDGLYNHPYSGNASPTYARGYQSGVDERARQSSYRPEYSRYREDGRSGGGAAFGDLVGARAAGAQSELGRRGFRQVANVQTGGNSVGTIWWNGQSGQCLQMITANGRADSITDIQTHPRCR
jgi:hypothetical protein